MTEPKKGFFRENLPWIAPTLAIVALGTGVFDRIAGLESGTLVSTLLGREAAGVEVTRSAAMEPGFPGYKELGSANDEVMASDVIAALVSAREAGEVAPAAAAPAAEPVALPVAAAPEPEPVARPAAAAPASEPLFTSNAAGLPDTARCLEDLRILSADARVYFPSGGVTGAEDGIAQARLLGLVAQECPGVTIQVEGHSDPSGDPSANMRLSEERAQAVIDRVSAAGIDTSMFRAVGFGDLRPATIRGDGPAAYYDRRVEFSIIEAAATAEVRPEEPASRPACVSRLEESVAGTRVFYAPRSIAVSQSDLSAAFQLAAAAAACPDARLRVIGQFSDDPASGETPATARMRAIAMMSMLVASGFEADQIIIAAPSEPTRIASAPGISDSRIDFDVIYDPS